MALCPMNDSHKVLVKGKERWKGGERRGNNILEGEGEGEEEMGFTPITPTCQEIEKGRLKGETLCTREATRERLI